METTRTSADVPEIVGWQRDSGDLLVATPPHPALQMSVIIPARDEEDHLWGALAALARQVDDDGIAVSPLSYEVIVLANNCRDATADVARAAACAFPNLHLHIVERVLPEHIAHVGTARRMLMDEAERRMRLLDRPRGIIASTDADTVVARTWVSATLRAFDRPIDAVGGRIIVGSDDRRALDRGALELHLRDVGYRSLATELRSRSDPDPWDPWPRHFQHFGPSTAVTASIYAEIGGLPPRASLEDVALYQALRRADARIRHDPAVQVTTSARASARTEFGFGIQLQRWSAMRDCGDPFLVPGAQELEARARAERDLRKAWQSCRDGHVHWFAASALAARLGVDRADLERAMEVMPTFGCLLEAVAEMQSVTRAWDARWPKVDIAVAIRELRKRLAPLRQPHRVVTRPTLQHIEAVDILAAGD